MQTVMITGGTGLVGRALTRHLLDNGYRVVVLTRSVGKEPSVPGLSYAVWDVRRQTIDVNAVRSADHIIHLAGAGVVDRRWTAAYKKEIRESRTLSSNLLVDAINSHPGKIRSLTSASAIGWYGPDKPGRQAFIESDPPSTDFLGQTCLLWEQSISGISDPGIRVSILRTGIVLSREGGALAEFRKPIRFGIAAILSSGKQMISWIHIEDLCRMYTFALQNANMQGSYNAVSNDPVTNKELTLKLGEAIRGKFIVPVHVPSLVLKIVLGESSVEVLKSTTVSNGKIKNAGFNFLYPTIGAALTDLTARK